MKKRKVGIFLCLCALFCLLCAAEETFPERLYDGKSFVEYAGTSDVPEVNGYSAYVYNVETGSVMYQKNPNDVVYPASTVKLMTAIVAYENIPELSALITASGSAVRAKRSRRNSCYTDCW